MNKILIMCDDLRIGGIQRLALDQSYELNRMGILTTVLSLSAESHSTTVSFDWLEKDLIEDLAVKLEFFPGSRFEQFLSLRKLFKNNDYIYVVGHTLRGSSLAWLLRFLFRYKFILITTIHQLPSLSAPVQRVKRYIYSQFSDQLLIFSKIAKIDWDNRRSRNPFIWLISNRKKVEVCRNGVYLNRLPTVENEIGLQPKLAQRLIYIGRLTSWKGLDTFLALAQMPALKGLKILMITPSDPKSYLRNIDRDLLSRIEYQTGKSVTQLNFSVGDIHIYPANPGAIQPRNYVEGVSINVLEMACLGIPSLITKGGSETWSELLELGMIKEVDWSDLESIAHYIKEDFRVPTIEAVRKSRALIDIGKNLNLILNLTR